MFFLEKTYIVWIELLNGLIGVKKLGESNF
jgi:hypothetical protein